MTVAEVYPIQEVQISLRERGCGHKIVMTREHYDACRESNRGWYCTVCGCSRQFTGKTTLDELRGELAAAKQREETEKARRRSVEETLRSTSETLLKEKQSKARLKKRIAAGVCPCCHRTVGQMARHMKTKHPEYAAPTVGEQK